MRDWGGKLVGTMVRIAALMHAAVVPGAPAETPISPEIMEAAVGIAEFLDPLPYRDIVTRAQSVRKREHKKGPPERPQSWRGVTQFYHERGRTAMSTNEELAARIQQGERALTGELWAQTERFVRRQAGRVYRALGPGAPVTAEDLYQSGYLALVAAVEGYDPDRGMSFIGYLALMLKTSFAGAGGWRSRKKDPLDLAVSLDAPLSDEDGGTLEDMVEDPRGAQGIQEAEGRLWAMELHTALERALQTLPEDESGAIRQHYYQGRTLEAIATTEGTSKEEIRKREAKGLRSLRHPMCSRPLRAFVEAHTDYYLHVGVERFTITGSSAVEELAMRRERLRNAEPEL